YGTDLRTFMRAHMGYRFVVRDIKFNGDSVDVTVENTGFGHLLMKSRGEIAIGAQKRPVPFDLRKLCPGERKTFTLRLPKGAPHGAPVRLTVRLNTPAAQVIHFANDALRDGDALRLQ
ncbi:MAG: DUF4832 domain-containing protein, partial [Kiritimatiellae bacterium]|nr:DUF4832 domain-containing protein [Kiritimatiellia bacterium]